MAGTGGEGTDFNEGVILFSADTEVSSIDGAITIVGIGGNGTGNFSRGINLENNSKIEVTNGLLTMTGTAIAGDSPGVRLSQSSSGQILSIGSGGIIINAEGTGTAADFQAGANSRIGFDGTTATSGDITINADSIDWSGSLNVQSTGDLTIQPRTPGTTIGLGGGAGTLNLDDAELGFLADGFNQITIGDATAGVVDIDSITLSDPVMIAGTTIIDNVGIDIDAAGNAVTLSGSVAPGQTGPGILNVTGNYAFATGASFDVESLRVQPRVPGTISSPLSDRLT